MVVRASLPRGEWPWPQAQGPWAQRKFPVSIPRFCFIIQYMMPLWCKLPKYSLLFQFHSVFVCLCGFYVPECWGYCVLVELIRGVWCHLAQQSLIMQLYMFVIKLLWMCPYSTKFGCGVTVSVVWLSVYIYIYVQVDLGYVCLCTFIFWPLVHINISVHVLTWI
jgi:hypothetical protein